MQGPSLRQLLLICVLFSYNFFYFKNIIFLKRLNLFDCFYIAFVFC
ncbi:hypothetical protein H359_0334 [Chlamydia ibidis 10-1398/6]|uniref:Uncharacterized protein n=1 Tax=Chlamydia ibidis 10-1398/6 TaxID=1046581 RepID=A0ABN0MZX4_9CHLA|nr:hypothetical protein H359_0334 [Chlamydia ibidis 10-1398/6]